MPGPMPTKDVIVHLIFVPDSKVTHTPVFDTNGNITDDAERGIRAFAQTAAGALKKTDVVVFMGSAWQFAGARRLIQHPQVHTVDRDTVLRLKRGNAERVVWWSELPFTITGVHNDDATLPVQDPFGSLPVATPEDDGSGTTVYVARASVHTSTANGQRFKISFTIGGQHIDPDMDCMA